MHKTTQQSNWAVTQCIGSPKDYAAVKGAISNEKDLQVDFWGYNRNGKDFKLYPVRERVGVARQYQIQMEGKTCGLVQEREHNRRQVRKHKRKKNTYGGENSPQPVAFRAKIPTLAKENENTEGFLCTRLTEELGK